MGRLSGVGREFGEASTDWVTLDNLLEFRGSIWEAVTDWFFGFSETGYGWEPGDPARFTKWVYAVDSDIVSQLNDAVGDFGQVGEITADSAFGNGLNFPGGDDNFWSTPDAASLDVTSGDMYFALDIEANDYTAGGNQTLISKFEITGNQRSWGFDINPSGQMRWYWSTDGSATVTKTCAYVLPWANSQAGAVRVTHDADNGSGVTEIKFYTATSIAIGDWVLRDTQTQAGIATIFNSTAPLRIGARDAGNNPFSGRIYNVVWANNLTGATPILNIVGDTDLDDGDLSFVDNGGRTWTAAGTATVGNWKGTSNNRDLYTIPETGTWGIAHVKTEIVGGPQWNPTTGVLFQHGVGIRAQEDTRRRTAIAWHDIFVTNPHVINLGVWSGNPDGSGFLNRQVNLFGGFDLGQDYTVTAAERTSGVVTATITPTPITGDRLDIEYPGTVNDVISVRVTVLDDNTIQYLHAGTDGVIGDATSCTRKFPYYMELRMAGSIAQVRCWDRSQDVPDWYSVTNALTTDLDQPHTAYSVVSASRTGGIVTMNIATPHKAVKGSRLSVAGMTDSSYDVSTLGILPIDTILSDTSFTFAQAGPDDASGGTGTVTIYGGGTGGADFINNPTPKGSGRIAIVGAHIGSSDLSKCVYGPIVGNNQFSSSFGMARASFGFTATASGGVPAVAGAASGPFGFTATAVGQPRTFGAGAASMAFTATAVAQPRTFGQAAATVGFTASANGLITSAQAVDYTPNAVFSRTNTGLALPVSFGAWFKFDEIPASYRIILYHGNASYGNYLALFQSSTGVVNAADGTGVRASTSVLSTGTWYYIAATVNTGTGNFDIYWRAEGESTLQTNSGTWSGTFANNLMGVGGTQASGETLTHDGAIAYARMWDSVLSQAELLAESAATTAVVTAWADWPMQDTTGNDVTANNRDLTLQNGTGSVTTAAGPDIAFAPGQSGTATGAFEFTATASGVPRTLGQAAATVELTGTAIGQPRTPGVAAAALAFAATASGQPRTPGNATASLGFTAAASGMRTTSGQAAATFGFTGTALGQPLTFGAATASIGLAATALGQPRTPGAAATAFGFTATALGSPRALGVAAGALTFTATAVGVRRRPGDAAAVLGFTGTAAGVPRTSGVATAPVAFTATALGRPRVLGVSTGTLGFAASAGGVPSVQGTAAAALGFAASSSGEVGEPPVTGQATGQFGFTATSAGVARHPGVAAGLLGFAAAAAGVSGPVGAAAGALGFTAVALGLPRPLGLATGPLEFTSTAVGQARTHGVGSGLLEFTATATGVAVPPAVPGQATALFGFAATATGQPAAPGVAAGQLGFTATALGRPRVLGAATGLGFDAAAVGKVKVSGSAAALLGFLAVAVQQAPLARTPRFVSRARPTADVSSTTSDSVILESTAEEVVFA